MVLNCDVLFLPGLLDDLLATHHDAALLISYREFAQERPLHAIGTRGYPWIEIDFPEDYRRAVREVLPVIDEATIAHARQVS